MCHSRFEARFVASNQSIALEWMRGYEAGLNIPRYSLILNAAFDGCSLS